MIEFIKPFTTTLLLATGQIIDKPTDDERYTIKLNDYYTFKVDGYKVISVREPAQGGGVKEILHEKGSLGWQLAVSALNDYLKYNVGEKVKYE